MKIRPAAESDVPAISGIHREAFGPAEGPEVAGLAAALLRDETARPRLSLVAEAGGRAIGHVLFTAAEVESPGEGPAATILSPLGVLPAFQRRGVGSLLVERGLELLAGGGADLAFVLGHPAYYPRFGFEPAGRAGYEAPYPIPERNAGAWMVRALRPGAVARFSGTVRCAAALRRPEHWRE